MTLLLVRAPSNDIHERGMYLYLKNILWHNMSRMPIVDLLGVKIISEKLITVGSLKTFPRPFQDVEVFK